MKNNFFSSYANPAMRRIKNFDETYYCAEVATYKGIMAKTFYFLATVLVGVLAFFYLHSFFANQGYEIIKQTGNHRTFEIESSLMGMIMLITVVCGLVAAFARVTIPVTGSIYCVGMGYSIALISYDYAAMYAGIVVEALILTLLIIAVMMVLYTSGIVQVGGGFKTVVYTALTASVIGGFIIAAMIIFAPNSYVTSSIASIQNGPIGILIAVGGVLLASALILCDFELIAETVEGGMAKKHEWYCSYSLMLSIILLYLKILRLLVRINGRRN